MTLSVAAVVTKTKRYHKALAVITSDDDVTATLRVYNRRGHELAVITGELEVIKRGKSYTVDGVTVTKLGGCGCGSTSVTEI